jgi:hypothetical protein
MKLIHLPMTRPGTRVIRLGVVPHRIFHIWNRWYLAMPAFDLCSREF